MVKCPILRMSVDELKTCGAKCPYPHASCTFKGAVAKPPESDEQILKKMGLDTEELEVSEPEPAYPADPALDAVPEPVLVRKPVKPDGIKIFVESGAHPGLFAMSDAVEMSDMLTAVFSGRRVVVALETKEWK